MSMFEATNPLEPNKHTETQRAAIASLSVLLEERFAPIWGPPRAWYETVNGVVDWTEDTDPLNDKETSGLEDRQRGMYSVFGFGVREGTDAPIERHEAILVAEWVKFLTNLAEHIKSQGGSLAVVVRRGFEFAVNSSEIWDTTRPSYSEAEFKEVAKMAHEAQMQRLQGKVDPFIEAQANANAGYRFDQSTRRWRLRNATEVTTRLTLRCHFRGLEHPARIHGFLPEGSAIVNVQGPMELLQRVHTEAPPLPVVVVGIGPCYGAEVTRAERQGGSLIVSDERKMAMPGPTDEELWQFFKDRTGSTSPLTLAEASQIAGGVSAASGQLGACTNPAAKSMEDHDQADSQVYQKPEPTPAPVHPHPGQGKPLNKD